MIARVGKGGFGVGGGEEEVLRRANAISSRVTRNMPKAAADAVKATLPTSSVAAAAIGAGAIATGAGAAALSKPNGQALFGNDPVSPEEIIASQMQKPGVLGKVETIVGAPASMPAMAVLAGGAAAGWAGEKMAASGVKKNRAWLQKTGDVLAAPKRWYTHFSFGDVGEKLGIRGAVGKVTQPVFNGAGAAAEKLGKWTGFSRWSADKHFGKAAVAHQNAREIAKGMNLDHAPTPEIRSALHDMRKAALKVAHPSGMSIEKIEKFGDAQKALAETVKAHSGKLGKEAQTLMKSAEKLGEYAEKAAHHTQQSAGWKNVREAFHNAPANISKAKVGSNLMHASWVALSALSMASDTKTFAHNLASLRQMYKDMTGEKDVSNMRLLLGNVPAPVAAARKALVANYGIKQVLDVANIGLNVKVNRMGFFISMIAFGAVQKLSQGVDSLVDVSVLPFYKGFSDAYKQGKTISPEAYAEFLLLASKDLHTRAKDDAAVMALAEKYAAEKLSPVEILNRASGTQLMADLNALIKANEAKAPQAVSQVAKLQGAPQATQPNVGPYTKAVNTARETAAQRSTEGPGVG